MAETTLDLLGDNLATSAEFLDGLSDCLDPLDDEGLVILRAQLEALRIRLAGAIAAVDLRICDLTPVGATVTVPGVGQVVVEARGKSSTDGPKLAGVLAARVADRPANEDGEPLPPAVLCSRTADELVSVFGLDVQSTRVRTSALKERGLKAGEFVSWTDGEPRVRFMAAGDVL